MNQLTKQELHWLEQAMEEERLGRAGEQPLLIPTGQQTHHCCGGAGGHCCGKHHHHSADKQQQK